MPCKMDQSGSVTVIGGNLKLAESRLARRRSNPKHPRIHQQASRVPDNKITRQMVITVTSANDPR